MSQDCPREDESPGWIADPPLTVAALRSVLNGLPDDMPIQGLYDSGFGRAPVTTAEPNTTNSVLLLWLDT